MAEFLDEVLENTTDTSPLEDLQPSVAKDLKEDLPKEEPKVEDIPEKYRGKSLKDIITMHQESEKLIGRQGSEVGELRKVVDDFIKTQTPKDSQVNETAVSDDDFFVEPNAAVKRAIDSHPAIKQAQDQAIMMKREQTLSQLKSEFPNVQDIVQSPDFADWIKSSKVRTELFARAETQFDYDSAKELLSNWNDKQSITKKVAETSKVDRDQQLKAADIGSNNGTSESVNKKKYRRSDIIKLMQSDPDRYDAMSNEIMAAYREGRVI
jgi:hypothetical protein